MNNSDGFYRRAWKVEDNPNDGKVEDVWWQRREVDVEIQREIEWLIQWLIEYRREKCWDKRMRKMIWTGFSPGPFFFIASEMLFQLGYSNLFTIFCLSNIEMRESYSLVILKLKRFDFIFRLSRGLPSSNMLISRMIQFIVIWRS